MGRNPALDTKVKAMQSQLLSEKDYSSLISAESLSEVFRYLKEKTHFGPYLQEINPDQASRVDIEAAFSKVVIDDTIKLDYFIYGNERDFLKLVLQRQDLENYLVILRAIAKNEDLTPIVKHLTFSDPERERLLENLVYSRSWNDFKKLLKNTIYYRAVETYNDLNSIDLFQLEKTLERSYYDVFYRQLKKISNSNKDLVKLLRSEIDMLNLIWIYRAKKFYNLSVDEIIPYIYRGGLYLNEEDLYRIALIDNYEELLKKLKSFRLYAFLFDHPEDNIDLYMDRRKKRYMFYAFKKLLFFGKAVAAAYSYLRMLEDETNDITSIIEGKRYDISDQDMEAYLIRSVLK